MRRVGGLAVAVLLAGLLAAPFGVTAASAPPVPPPGLPTGPPVGPTWTNGAVALTFPFSTPLFELMSVSDGRISAAVNVSAVSEVTPGGQVVATAALDQPNVTWEFRNLRTPSAVLVQANASVPVAVASGDWDDATPVDGGGAGNVSVYVDFRLNASGGPSPDTLTFSLIVLRWPWLNVTDSLGLALGMIAVGGSGLVAAPENDAVVEEAVGSSTAIARLYWDANATTSYATNTTSTAAVGSYRNVTTGDSMVRLTFGQVLGGYDSLSYDPYLSLNPLAFGSEAPAWLLSPGGLASLAVGTVVVVSLAVVAVRRRSEVEPDP